MALVGPGQYHLHKPTQRALLCELLMLPPLRVIESNESDYRQTFEVNLKGVYIATN